MKVNNLLSFILLISVLVLFFVWYFAWKSNKKYVVISLIPILKFKFLNHTPIALEKVFFNMLNGVIILDCENNIVNFNNASKNIISDLKYVEGGNKKI